MKYLTIVSVSVNCFKIYGFKERNDSEGRVGRVGREEEREGRRGSLKKEV